MSPAPALKHNPGLRGDQDVIGRFAARHLHYGWILDRIREAGDSSSDPCQHMLVVGARGMGKTTLVRRVAAEIRRDPSLSACWFPIVFPEEAYLPMTAGEFWLEAIFHLAEHLDDDDFRRTYADLRGEPDESRLHERCLAVLLDYSDRSGKRLLLIVENAGMLFGEQISDAAAWKLRQTLSHEPRILMLATATARFEEIDGVDKAWFELFAQHALEPLSRQECTSLWTAVNGEPPEGDSIRAVEILTGGNPRLVTIVAEFSARRSFRELMDRLIELVDSHTEYFKSHLDALPAQERKVFAVLLDLWAPATASQTAEQARLSTNVCSSLLKRLAGRGAVTITGEHKRDRRYQVTERLFNIYYLMRRRGENQQRAEMLVHFMKAIYSARDLREMVKGMGRDLWNQPIESRKQWFAVLNRLASQDSRVIAPLTPPQLRILDAPQQLRAARESVLERESRLYAHTDFPLAQLAMDPAFEITDELLLSTRQQFDRMRLAGDPPAQTLSKVASTIGIVLFARAPDALAHTVWWAEQARDLDPGNHQAWRLLGQVAIVLQKDSDARNAIERSLVLEPADECTWYLRISLCDGQDSAMDVMARMFEALPDSGLYWRTISRLVPEVLQICSLPPSGKAWEIVAQIVCGEGVPGGAGPLLGAGYACIALEGGQIPQFIEALRQEDRNQRFEVLVAALTILIGQQPSGPAEVLAVARDLAAKISEAATPPPPPPAAAGRPV